MRWKSWQLEFVKKNICLVMLYYSGMNRDNIFLIGKHFQNKPIEFSKVVLGLTLSADQQHILHLLTLPPYKVLVRSANTCGKSFISAVAAIYTFTCYPESTVIITAPTAYQVQRIIFKELRNIGTMYADLFLPKASTLYHTQNHQILGYTSSTGTSFQGLHGTTICGIVDESVGVDNAIFEAIAPMIAGPGSYTLLLFNPTDSTSYPYTLERSGKAHLVVLNALKHENIIQELQGKAAPFPNAIRLANLRKLIDEWCEISKDPSTEDFEFDGKMYHPSPVAECRILGRYPTEGANSIWTDALFTKCCELDVGDEGTVQIGNDVACFGDDDSAFAVRRGGNLIHLEWHNGWSPMQQVERLKALSMQYRLAPTVKPAIVIDETGVGMAVSTQGYDYAFQGINFASKAMQPLRFRNKRDELHFTIADKAKAGEVSFKKLAKYQQDILRIELLATTYSLDYQGRRFCEPKLEVKKRLGKSPDLAEAVMMAYYPVNCDTFTIENIKPKHTKRNMGF